MNADERAIVSTVRQFVDRELIEEMKGLGVYGLVVPPEHGGLGVSTACFAGVTEDSQEYPVERFYCDAPLMVVGEDTNEIQRSVIARQLVERGLPWV